jgi:hypothetical protein
MLRQYALKIDGDDNIYVVDSVDYASQYSKLLFHKKTEGQQLLTVESVQDNGYYNDCEDENLTLLHCSEDTKLFPYGMKIIYYARQNSKNRAISVFL